MKKIQSMLFILGLSMSLFFVTNGVHAKILQVRDIINDNNSFVDITLKKSMKGTDYIGVFNCDTSQFISDFINLPVYADINNYDYSIETIEVNINNSNSSYTYDSDLGIYSISNLFG